MDSGAKMEQFMLKRMRQVEEQVTDGAIQIEGKSQKLQAVLPVAEELAIEVKDETIDVEMINTRFSLEHPREVCFHIFICILNQQFLSPFLGLCLFF